MIWVKIKFLFDCVNISRSHELFDLYLPSQTPDTACVRWYLHSSRQEEVYVIITTEVRRVQGQTIIRHRYPKPVIIIKKCDCYEYVGSPLHTHNVISSIITYLVLYTVNINTDISRMTQRHTSTVAKHRINDITHVWYRWYDVLPLRPCAHARSSSNNSAYFGGDHALTGNWSWPGTAILL